jgi:hypothetical protein
MNQRNIPTAETFVKWRTDPEYVAAYEALEEEFGIDRMALKMIRSDFFEVFDFMKFDVDGRAGSGQENPKRIPSEKK